jgi:hypothetical protein
MAPAVSVETAGLVPSLVRSPHRQQTAGVVVAVNLTNARARARVCVCVCVCVRARVHVLVLARAWVC